jgi:hypothetical protein
MTANPEQYLGNKFFDQIVGGHREWLSRFDDVYLRKWDKMFTRGNSEAALCEAATRQLLEELDIDVEPCELGGNDRSPDFKCQKDGNLFYVDATCVMKDTVTRKSGLEDIPQNGKTSGYALLTDTYFKKADSKETQFKHLNAPCIIVIGTFHFSGGQLCFDDMSVEEILTGTTGIGMQINTQTGSAIGKPYNEASLQNSSFLTSRRIICDGPPVQPVKQTISAVILCPFGTHPVECLGVLHPEPFYHFDRGILPQIKFCQLKDGWRKGILKTEWV